MNIKVLKDFLDTEKYKQLKFTNPLRDYSHLLSGRLVTALIKLESMIKDLETYGNLEVPKPKKSKKNKKKNKKKKGKKGEAAEEEPAEEEEVQPQDENKKVFPSKQCIKKLQTVHDHCKQLMKDQLLYQKDSVAITESNTKMREAERQIEKFEFAQTLKDYPQGKQVIGLMIKKQDRDNKIWHPVLGEFQSDSLIGDLSMYTEYNILVKMENHIPLKLKALVNGKVEKNVKTTEE